jgi:hypothetical protein
MSDVPPEGPAVDRRSGGAAEPWSIEQFEAKKAEDQAKADELAARVVGLSEKDAEQLLAAEGCSLRVGRRDGQSFALTLEYRPDRITVTVVGGKVVDAKARG